MSNEQENSSTTNILENVQQNKDNMADEFDLFAKLIASELRQMPFFNAQQCQEKIETVVDEECFLIQLEKTLNIKQEPATNDQDPLVYLPNNIQTMIKQEPSQ